MKHGGLDRIDKVEFDVNSADEVSAAPVDKDRLSYGNFLQWGHLLLKEEVVADDLINSVLG